MVCRLLESWESSTNFSDYTGKWTGSSSPSLGTSFGRFGNGMRAGAGGGHVYRTFDYQATWTIGAAIRPQVMRQSAMFSIMYGPANLANCRLNNDESMS